MKEKHGMLVVSFGTSHNDTREKTIDAIEKQIAEHFTGCQVYRAWTSGMIIRKLRERDGCRIDTVQEAVRRMLDDGVTHLTVQPTHIVNGIENDRMKQDVMVYADRFASVRFGTPLLTTDEDAGKVIRGIMGELNEEIAGADRQGESRISAGEGSGISAGEGSGLWEDTALIFMGHGTTHYANSIYAALDYRFKDMGYANVFVGTVEAYPSMETLRKRVREGSYRRVILTPFMIVAGEHAKHDMASDEEESWKCQFEAEGLEVSCLVKGLGEYESVRRLFVEHAVEAQKEE